ncbi:MAG: hypothetical protein HYR55_10860 [Acidobacteria bacterium]|nr:hypothetical protein [Acidobacteriota bacterium]MBI3655656.1 hypothetical protein [Acidobacteriota bacterium]
MKPRLWPWAAVFGLAFSIMTGTSRLDLRAGDAPLPDLTLFLKEVRTKLIAQGEAKGRLENYTYRKKVLEETLRRDNTVKSAETTEYRVYHSKSGPYNKMISKNNVPLSLKELKKQDDALAEKERKRREHEAELSVPQRQAKADERRKKRREELDDIFSALNFTLLGRDLLEDRRAIVVAFRPKQGATLRTMIGKAVVRNIVGKAWIDEDDHELMKIVIETIDDIHFGAGVLAKLGKGTMIFQEWRKVNNEVWLPQRTELRMKARVLLVKGFNLRRVEEYWDYQKLGARESRSRELSHAFASALYARR